MADPFPGETIHTAPDDLRTVIAANPALLSLWAGLTPLGRNEFICGIEEAKQAATRQRRIARTGEELHEGKKRPCCWDGCIQRTDKGLGKWQQAVLIDGNGRKNRAT